MTPKDFNYLQTSLKNYFDLKQVRFFPKSECAIGVTQAFGFDLLSNLIVHIRLMNEGDIQVVLSYPDGQDVVTIENNEDQAKNILKTITTFIDLLESN
ncbi:MAG: hypothetical protein ACXAC2_16630 [Candidatus Kariarchaeaceae archaeon]|jgi:hypothetical protein